MQARTKWFDGLAFVKCMEIKKIIKLKTKTASKTYPIIWVIANLQLKRAAN